MYKKILVAVDDSPERETVLHHAAAFADAVGAAVHVLHIQTIDTGVLGTGVIEEETGMVRDLVESSVKELTARGVTAEGEIREAIRPDIAGTVLSAAADQRADLIVLGVRRHTGLTGLVLGSVADGVTHGSPPCPVLLIP
jgi:nucleotide-binding universal stress UspA family protein